MTERQAVPSPHYYTFSRAPISFEKGEGAWLTDQAGRRYLDFTSGVAVNSLGHAHPVLVAALKDQAEKLWHSSNLFRVAGQEKLAVRLCALSFADKVFFANSGAEAVECAIKTARRHFFHAGEPKRIGIITFEGAFHGRTLATLAATNNPKYLEGFGPKAEGFTQLPLGDLGAVRHAIGADTAAIMIEPIQGEGGVRVVPGQFLRELRRLCDESGILLIFDEVQTGMGRTGKLFAYEWSGVAPDIMTLAKGIGGGFPLGACLATAEAADGMTAGTHGSTFGGNPLAMAVANAALDVITGEGFLDRVCQTGLFMKQRLAAVLDAHPNSLDGVRGEGLLIGVHAIPPVGEIVASLRSHGLLVAAAGDNVIRLMPPLNVTEAEIDEAMRRLDQALSEMERSSSASAKGAAQP